MEGIIPPRPQDCEGHVPRVPPVLQPMGSREGHLWSQSVFRQTRDRKEMKTRKWCQTTWLAKMFRKICILTYLGHDLTLTWPDLRSVFEIDLPRSKDTFFESSPRAEHDGVIFIFVFYKKNSEKPSARFFSLMTSGSMASTPIRHVIPFFFGRLKCRLCHDTSSRYGIVPRSSVNQVAK